MTSWLVYAKRKKKKFRNKKVERDGYSMGSQLEASVYGKLKERAEAGELVIEQTQDHVYLTRARIGYVPDFRCRDLETDETFWVEAKGFANDRWPIIRKLWKFYGPGRLEIWKGSHAYPYLDEVIIPEAAA
jgi:hypothetical protein